MTGADDATRASFVPTLARAATEADGSPPFSDQTLVDVRSGAATVIGDQHAAAGLRDGEAELVVHPDDRRQGRGAELLQRLVDETEGPLLLWAHGDHPGSRVLAARFGRAETRRRLQQRADVPDEPRAPRLRDGDRVAPFRPGVDDRAWLDLTARAFADHPAQGSLVPADLDARKAEPWFDAGDFVLLWRGDELLAFCWLKLDEGQPGEFYAVGVAPDHQGEGRGGAVVDAGFARLTERGAGTAALYVEGDNTAALRLYAARGFTDHAVDVQYTLTR
ncbi:mycothiol synthase [Frigoribacterium sp. RIT-PI-h]|uniref:mycothiol synthase n=1 Tax=Frigoribacterium sp. RIT-PI-h TaxID=1690245 RepID=UPI0013791E8D|nr:mycothiol synthase [Frigoribacterium sp. RIT-PI-h]